MYHIKPFSNAYPPFINWDDAFNSEELDHIQNLAKKASIEGKVGDNAQVVDSIRRSKISWIQDTEDNIFIFDRLANVVNQINADYYHFSLHSFAESIQLTNYDFSEQGHYSWHQDIGHAHSRKLSLVLQLSDPKEYEGGNLQILIKSEPETIRKQRGGITVFPSWALHRVTPVVSGNRQTLVAWVTGERFK